MKIEKEKILVFDADVLIHFMRAERFSSLMDIFPSNRKVVLEKVVEELSVYHESKVMLESAINTFKILSIASFPVSNEMMQEFAHLTSLMMNFGKGESACMSYCKFTGDVVVSSNLKDVGEYCKRHAIPLITTMDLVEEALVSKLWTEAECDEFISSVIGKGGKLTYKNMTEYLRRKK